MSHRNVARPWRTVALLGLLWLLGGLRAAAAHDVPPSVVLLDMGRRAIDMELRLQCNELGAALGLPLTSARELALSLYGEQIKGYVLQQVHLRAPTGGQFAPRVESLSWRQTANPNWTSNDWLVVHMRFQAPEGFATETFALDYGVILQRVLSHNALVYVRHDIRNGLIGDQPMLIGMMSFGRTHLEADGSAGNWWQGFRRLFDLGMHHIAQGPDHLLFLLALLLSAPLRAGASGWAGARSGRESLSAIVRVVSGFTLGHSLTLGLVASGWLPVNTRLIETLIAVSILVSSLHAWRPLFAGKEAWIAAGFGLIHGMAFAEALSGLNFDHCTLVLSLLGFNVGIEAMQLLIIAIALPPFLLLSPMPAYAAVRITGASFAMVCAIGWILERGFRRPNILAPIVDRLSTLPPGFVLVAIVGSVLSACLLWARTRSGRCPGVVVR